MRITGDDLWFDFNSPFHISESDSAVTLLADYSSMDFPTELVSIRIGDDKSGQAHSTPLKAECEIIPEPVHISRISHVNDDILSQLDPVKTEAQDRRR